VTQPKEPLHLDTALRLTAAGERRHYSCRLIRAGRIRRADNTPGPYDIPAAAIQAAVDDGLFNARATFVDHAGWFDSPSLRNLAGITVDATWNAADKAADATIRLYDNPAGNIVASLFDQVLADAQNGDPIPDVGLSLVFYPRWKPRTDGTSANIGDPLVLAEFRHVESIDFVFQPAADGRVKDALTALSALSLGQPGDEIPTPASPNSLRAQRSNRAALDPGTHAPKPTRSETMPREKSDTTNVGAHCDAPTSTQVPAPDPVALPAPSAAQQAGDWLAEARVATVETLIQQSGLPKNVQTHLRAQSYDSPADVRAAIELQRGIIADLHADRVVQMSGQPPRDAGISLGRTPLEQIESAFEALMLGVTPPEGVAPLSGVREMYHLLSGDYDMHGVFHGDRIQFANVNSSTMASITANVLNKAVINYYMQYPRWWERIVSVQDFTTLQQVKWITLGGVGELPTVAEGAAYTELTWDDQSETADFVKKGGYLGITLEAIDKDDTRRLRAAPKALAQAAWLTLGKSVSAIFTANSGTGPTMADTGALFNATAVSTAGGHANLLTTALSHAQWIVVRTAMMKQAEVNSGERLGFLTAPKYCLVPVDLEITALVMFASEGVPGGANNDQNVFAAGEENNTRLSSARDRVVVVPHWTDTNNWAAVADPLLYPSIGIGFRYGRTPQIFSVASPTAGLMFTNDTLPVKVRFIFAVGPTDWRGLHKSNVA
jgi:hypothetical protein